MQSSSSPTESLCPHCLRRIPAHRTLAGDSIYMEKSCPEHGAIPKTLLWTNDPWPYEEWDRHKPATSAAESESQDEGCPFECGICAKHRQATCTAIIEVTHGCGMQCPVCFAGSEPGTHPDPDLAQIEQMLETVREKRGICPLQLSGGEPTLREDLPDIIALAGSMGFDHVQVNTNGLRIAQDLEYARSLKGAGLTDIFLQFDGVTDDVYLRIRGARLLSMKLKAIENCAALKTGLILVPTLVRNVNETQIGAIIQLAKKWIPVVKGVHFQPVTYMGRYPAQPRNEDRILIPEILKAIEQQTGGELRVENMVPPG